VSQDAGYQAGLEPRPGCRSDRSVVKKAMMLVLGTDWVSVSTAVLATATSFHSNGTVVGCVVVA
jgi:hypothetical protein